MATYFLRDKNGILKARLPGHAAYQIFDQADGFFREAKYTDGAIAKVFEIATRCKIEVGGVDVFLWEGDVVILEKG